MRNSSNRSCPAISSFWIDIPETKSRFGKGEGFINVDGEAIAKINMMFALVDP